MNETAAHDTVLVTGGSGYLAGWMIAGLLDRGFRVRATLRDLARQADVARAIASAAGDTGDRLAFAQADLLSDAGWADATAGCRYVIHVASPMGQPASNDADLIGPAVDGTLRVLAAASASGVERVVCTSSGFAAQPRTVAGERQPLADETVWGDPDEKGTGNYARSKILAERAAWDFMETRGGGMTLSTILPGLILGPTMTRTPSPSLELVARLLNGKIAALPDVGFCVTEVRALVDLHICAMTHPSAANQRFIGAGDFMWFAEIADAIRDALPDRAAGIARKRVPDWMIRLSALVQKDARFLVPMLGKRREFDSGKAAALLQWTPTPSRTAVVGCARSLVAHGAV